MLVDKHNHFLSQRENARMALLAVNITAGGLKVIDRSRTAEIIIPYKQLTEEFADVIVWDDTCKGQLVSKEADKWFTAILNMECRLVYMPNDTRRLTNPKYTIGDKITSFSDAYPFMMIGQASLNDLNSRMALPLPINRFRPNIVFTGGTPYQEDTMDSITINNIAFNGVKLCARCNIPTIDQNTAIKAKEPLKTFATYRNKNKEVYFGQNLVGETTGVISVGDELVVLTTHTNERFMV